MEVSGFGSMAALKAKYEYFLGWNFELAIIL
ncbi:Uncharacterised protein [uncultured archaeon]|nr:Uncharacterised protein [uncultured archaeon]